MIIDRLVHAAKLAAGKRVLDLGGALQPGTDKASIFARTYSAIHDAAREYRVVDFQDKPGVDYVLDFNRAESIPALRKIVAEYKPELILCMEMLEHVNRHTDILDVLAEAVDTGAKVFISIPNVFNWIPFWMNWHDWHILVFTRGIASRFISHSALGRHSIKLFGTFGRYRAWWREAYAACLFQPLSWAFEIERKKA